MEFSVGGEGWGDWGRGWVDGVGGGCECGLVPLIVDGNWGE